MSNHGTLLIDYAATHLRLMSMKDPQNFPKPAVDEAVAALHQALLPVSRLDLAILALSLMASGGLIGFALGIGACG